MNTKYKNGHKFISKLNEEWIVKSYNREEKTYICTHYDGAISEFTREEIENAEKYHLKKKS